MATTTFNASSSLAILKRSDVAFSLGLITILAVMVLPMPSLLLDLALAFSLAFSILILMTSLFIEKPLEFSSFPTILLVSTMIRLALNVASTRLILGKGHEGPHAAGKVIQAFGELIMGGNFVIGMIVFSILVIVNFVVITKGSGRIAEVSARFSLDAMPGKQMAIDADLSAGLIDEATAKKRRKTLEEESNFYGSMDGAAKFVRGDAIAGILITFINIIGGIIIGVLQNDLEFVNAMRTYTLLTVGDGLVSQIPALIVSTSAGMLVSKGGVEGTTDKALIDQFSAYPMALGMSSFLMGVLALLPSVPMIPFAALAGLAGYSAWYLSEEARKKEELKEQEIQAQQTVKPAVEEPVSAALQMDAIKIELGYGLLGLLNEDQEKKLTDQIKVLRKQLAQEIGFLLPPVRIQDNLHLDPDTYLIRIKEMEAGRGSLKLNMLLAMDPYGNDITFEGEDTIEPTFGLKAKWINNLYQEDAQQQGITVVEPLTVLTTHLTELARDNISELLTYGDVQKLLEELPESYKKLLNDIVPGQVTVGTIQRILQNLVCERVSIRDLPTILEGISEATGFTRNITLMTEHVRTRLMRQITFSNTTPDGSLNIVSLSPQWEQTFSQSLYGDGEVKQLAMNPSQLQEFINHVKTTFDKLILSGDNPVLVTSPPIRPYVRSVLERTRPSTIILSQSEVHPKVKIKTFGLL